MENTETPELTQEELEKLAAEYRTYPNKKGRPPKRYAKQIAAINKQQERMRVKVMPTGEKKVIIAKPDKLEAFMEEFIKNGGNATQAALVVTKVKNITSAASTGSQLLKQAKVLGRIVMEKKGFHYGKMIDVGIEKMATSKTPEWWDRLMRISGYEGFEPVKKSMPMNVNIIGTVRKDADEFGFGEENVIDGEEE